MRAGSLWHVEGVHNALEIMESNVSGEGEGDREGEGCGEEEGEEGGEGEGCGEGEGERGEKLKQQSQKPF